MSQLSRSSSQPENSISSNAYRPDDVITYRNGKTVEITNTDAEGRLVLADGLIWAAELENPACIIDMATLTGGVVTALEGTNSQATSPPTRFQATFESRKNLRRSNLASAPRRSLQGHDEVPVADLQNSNLGGKAHPVQGAVFLWAFIPEGLPWAHIDIAGVSNTSKDSGPLNPGQDRLWGQASCWTSSEAASASHELARRGICAPQTRPPYGGSR